MQPEFPFLVLDGRGDVVAGYLLEEQARHAANVVNGTVRPNVLCDLEGELSFNGTTAFLDSETITNALKNKLGISVGVNKRTSIGYVRLAIARAVPPQE